MADYEKQFSTTSVNAGGRDGRSRLADGSYEVNIVPPGSKREGTNPEELFALGYSACYHSALDAVKSQENVDNKSIVRTTVTLNQVPKETDFRLGVVIEVGFEGLEDGKAQELADKANEVCPYSRAVKNGELDLEVKVVPYKE